MRKKTLLLNAGVLFLTTIIVLSAETALAQPILTIEGFGGGLNAHAFIKNVGDTNATSISWNMKVMGNIVFFGKNTSGKIPVLAPNASMKINTGLIVGFGRIYINASATCAEGAEYSEIGQGFVLLFLIVGVSEPLP